MRVNVKVFGMVMKICCGITTLLCLLPVWVAQKLVAAESLSVGRKPQVEPQIRSLFPLGITLGKRAEVKVRGQHLQEAYAVWLDCQSITAQVKAVEELPPQEEGISEKTPVSGQAILDVSVAGNAEIGTHFLHLISPAGLSNAMPFVVLQEPMVIESDLASEPGQEARRLPAVPIVVSGTIAKPGEVDTYSFEAERGQELTMEVFSGGTFDPELSVYEPSGSWFDPKALRRLAFSDEPNTASKNLSPALTYRFERKGGFLAVVGSFLGTGGPDNSYQLRMVPSHNGLSLTAPAPVLVHHGEGPWQERTFARLLRHERIAELRARSAGKIADPLSNAGGPAAAGSSGSAAIQELSGSKTKAAKLAEEIASVSENEASEKASQLQSISIPALIEGTIDLPGDVDRFRFQVSDGARVAFELETPAKPAPFLTPRLGVYDETGQEVLNNIYSFIQGSGEFIERVIEPKVTYKFERGGEYVLEIQDLISRNGGPNFRYRVMVRPQIPHVGRIEVASSFGRTFDGSITKGPPIQRLNIVPGEAKKLLVLTDQEEGFDGQVAVSIEGLPQGVEAFPATEVEPERAHPLDAGKKERFRPAQQVATIVVAAAADAPRTRLPKVIRVKARPVVNGAPGPVLPVQTIPVMVVATEQPSQP